MKGVEKTMATGLTIVAIVMAIYQLLYTQILVQSPDGHLITHLGFGLVVVFQEDLG